MNLFRKTKKEIDQEIESKRPLAKTKIKPIKLEVFWLGKKQEIEFFSKEELVWILSFQNPKYIKEISNKYKNLLDIEGLGKGIKVSIR